MASPELIIRGQQVVLPDGIAAASIHIKDGKILDVGRYDDVPQGVNLIEAGDLVIMPGLVDTHVHVNEPGRTEWEGFRTATLAAAAGGVTTLIDMPLNSIPATTTLEAFLEKQAAARGQCSIDVGFWGGVVPGNTPQIAPLAAAGVVGFKCFLIHSGVDEFPNVTEEDLRKAMPELARLDSLLIVHAELPGPIERTNIASCNKHQPSSSGKEFSLTQYQTFLDSRPRAAENEAVELMIRLGREFGTRIHIVHHSSADALPMIAEAKESGLKLTAETCPHYLTFAAEDIPDGATEFKCCPPIRERENREQLWAALRDGTIEMIVSDHSPCPPDLKLPATGDFLQAWGGISSLQLRLAAVWTEARTRGFSIEQLVEWLCSGPAKLVGLEKQKGSIVPGADADIVLWNTDEEYTVGPEMVHHRHKLTPYAGRRLQGVVHSTFLRGKKIFEANRFIGSPAGIFLTTQRDTNN